MRGSLRLCFGSTLAPEGTRAMPQATSNHRTGDAEPAIPELHALIDGEPHGEPIPAGLIDDDALEAAWPDAVARLVDGHRRFLAAIDRAIRSEPPLDRTVPALFLIKVDDGSGERRPLEWIEWLDWKSFALLAHIHTLEHLDQIDRILARTTPA